mgnify:CR=1 FL=1
MSNSNEMERLWRLQTKVNMLVSDGKRSPTVIADALQTILDQPQPKFELYLFGKQKAGGWEMGYNIERHLKKTGLINRCLSKDDECVRNWLANPETYPEEFKGKAVFLWKSADGRVVNRVAPCLIWRDGGVVLHWDWLDLDWYGGYPAVLAGA